MLLKSAAALAKVSSSHEGGIWPSVIPVDMVIHGKDSAVCESDGVEGRVHVWQVHFPCEIPPQAAPAMSQQQQSDIRI